MRDDDIDYLRKALALALRFSPCIFPCPACGEPRAVGLRCGSCPRPTPAAASVSHPDWFVEVSWDHDYGWIVSEPHEDDGEMEIRDNPYTEDDDETEARANPREGKVTKKLAVVHGIDVARERRLPLRIYPRSGRRVTTIALAEIE